MTRRRRQASAAPPWPAFLAPNVMTVNAGLAKFARSKTSQVSDTPRYELPRSGGAFLASLARIASRLQRTGLSYGGFLMQKWELTYEIIGSAVAIGALLVLLWHFGFVS